MKTKNINLNINLILKIVVYFLIILNVAVLDWIVYNIILWEIGSLYVLGFTVLLIKIYDFIETKIYNKGSE